MAVLPSSWESMSYCIYGYHMAGTAVIYLVVVSPKLVGEEWHQHTWFAKCNKSPPPPQKKKIIKIRSLVGLHIAIIEKLLSAHFEVRVLSVSPFKELVKPVNMCCASMVQSDCPVSCLCVGEANLVISHVLCCPMDGIREMGTGPTPH